MAGSLAPIGLCCCVLLASIRLGTIELCQCHSCSYFWAMVWQQQWQGLWQLRHALQRVGKQNLWDAFLMVISLV